MQVEEQQPLPAAKSASPEKLVCATHCDHRAQLVTSLTLLGFDQPLTTQDIQGYLHTLRHTADTITRTTGGHPPN